MSVYIEWILLDNMLMNFLILRLSGAMARTKLRRKWPLFTSTYGAVYAALSIINPALGNLPGKLALCLVMVLGMRFITIKDYLRCILSVFLSTFLIGGITLSASYMTGGGMAGGALNAGIPLRAALTIFSRRWTPRAISSIWLYPCYRTAKRCS